HGDGLVEIVGIFVVVAGHVAEEFTPRLRRVNYLRHRNTGCRAARASSRRRTGVVCGALRTSSGRSSHSRAMAIMASQNASSSSFGSLSVGSIMRAPETMRGK